MAEPLPGAPIGGKGSGSLVGGRDEEVQRILDEDLLGDGHEPHGAIVAERARRTRMGFRPLTKIVVGGTVGPCTMSP